MLDDPAWLRERYRTQTAVQIATELGVASRTVYAAMDRHGIERRTEPGALKLRRPQLSDTGWLGSAVDRGSSRAVAAELEVSAGTVTTAYERAGIDPASSTRFYERGHKKRRPRQTSCGPPGTPRGRYEVSASGLVSPPRLLPCGSPKSTSLSTRRRHCRTRTCSPRSAIGGRSLGSLRSMR